MNITFLGHSSFLIEWNGHNIIIDPFISGNPKASEIDVNSLSADYLLISHGHQDHILDVDAIMNNNPEATIISNFEIVTYFEKKGYNGHPMNHGGKAKFPFGTVKYVNAIHTSSFPDGSYAGNPGGFVFWDETKCVYFAGDTALTRDMKLISKTCPKVNLAILPIGDNFTMDFNEAVWASDYVKCDLVIGCHYDTFPAIEIDKPKAQARFVSRGKELLLPNIGDTIKI